MRLVQQFCGPFRFEIVADDVFLLGSLEFLYLKGENKILNFSRILFCLWNLDKGVFIVAVVVEGFGVAL